MAGVARRAVLWAGLGLLLGVLGTSAAAQTAGSKTIVLHGAGATFPAPLYKKWIGVFMSQNPDVSIDYQEVGSGEGARRVPATAGMVVLAYNLPELGGDLKLSREVYVDIFLRRIQKWNDARIQALNPGLMLPNLSIVIAARKDSSGTTFALANHLSAINSAWRDGPGAAFVVDWSGRAMLARGNEGVAGLVKNSEGALGYVEYGFADRLRLPMARLQNRAGEYVAPNSRSGQTTLASNVRSMPENLRLYLPDPEGAESYPILSLTWLLLYERYPDQQKGAALKRFVTWGLTGGQSFSADLGYIALPPEVAALSRAALERVQ